MGTRREALKIIGAVGATCSFPFSANELFGQHVHAAEGAVEAPAAVPFAPKFFSAKEFRVVSRLADLIIPTTDTPGAVAAGVPQYIDLVVSDDRKLQAIIANGLRGLQKVSEEDYHAAGFLAVSEAQQIEILTKLSEAPAPKVARPQDSNYEPASFFEAIKNLTADGYYTSKIGLLQELGYSGNAVLAAFPEATIPEQ